MAARSSTAELDYLDLCGNTVRKLEKISARRKHLLNPRQCKDLLSKLSKTTQNVRELVLYCETSTVPFRPAEEYLYRCVEQAEALVRSCADHDWLKTAVFQIDNENAFRMILLDLSLCYNAIYELAKSTRTDWSDPPEDLRQPVHCSVFKPARNSDVDEDKVDLQKRLDDLANGYTKFKPMDYLVPGKISRTQSLAKYLLVKMRSTPSDPQEVALSKYSGILWRKDSEPMSTWGIPRLLGAGSGASGVVRTTWLGVPCAKKELFYEFSDGAFVKEAVILAHLKHPCVARFVCCGNGLEKGDRFIAMELMEKSLADLIEEQLHYGANRFALPIVVDMMVQIARGVCYLHGRGVAHGDLKPQNVLVNKLTSPHGESHYCVKLIYFGISEAEVDEFPALFDVRIRYGEGKRFEEDVFSFATTCAWLLSLGTPYGGIWTSFGGIPGFDEIDLEAMLDAWPKLLVDCPVELVMLLRDCWNTSPKLVDCPVELVMLLRDCWNTSPKSRPTFKEVCIRLEKIQYALLMGFVGGKESDQSNNIGLNFIEEKVEEQSSYQVMFGDTIGDDKETLPQSNSIQNLISSTMTLLGVQQSSTKVKYGSGNFLQDFQGHEGGSLRGRFNVELMEIQILFSSLESMVSVTGLGLKLDPNQLVLVTLSGCNSSKVVMTRLEKEECEKMTSSGGAFYMIHFDVDIDEDHDHIMKRPQNSPPTSSESDSTIASAMDLEEYKSVEEIAEDSSMYVACRVHTFAKLILLLGLKETRDVPLTKFKDFSVVWDWKDMEMALGVYEEEQKSIANSNSEQVNKRPSGYEGDNESRGFRKASNLPSNNKGKAKCNQSGALYGDGNGIGGGGGDGGEDNDGFDPSHQRLLPSSSKSQEEKNFSIEVRPGYGCYKEDENKDSWPYKKIQVFATPIITISFRNCFSCDSKEVHAKLEVNFDLAYGSDPSASDLEKDRFAWYHDSFEFSIQCIEDEAAELKVGSGSVHNMEPVKSTVSNMTTRNSKSSQKAFSTELNTFALLPVQNKTKVSYTRNGPSSSLAIGEMRENLNRETVQGFLARQKFEGGSKPRIGCAFKHAKSKDIEAYIHEASGRFPDMEQYLDEDMCSSQAQVIEGAFRPLVENKPYYAYSFNCYRRIVGFFWAKNITNDISGIQKWKQKLLCKADRSSIKNIKHCKRVTCEQSFDVGLYINHGMKQACYGKSGWHSTS